MKIHDSNNKIHFFRYCVMPMVRLILHCVPQQYHNKIGSVIDGIVISSNNLNECVAMQQVMIKLLKKHNCIVNEEKSINPTEGEVPILGYVVKPNSILIKEETCRKMQQRIGHLMKDALPLKRDRVKLLGQLN